MFFIRLFDTYVIFVYFFSFLIHTDFNNLKDHNLSLSIIDGERSLLLSSSSSPSPSTATSPDNDHIDEEQLQQHNMDNMYEHNIRSSHNIHRDKQTPSTLNFNIPQKYNGYNESKTRSTTVSS